MNDGTRGDTTKIDLSRLATEQRNATTSGIDRLVTLDMVRLINAQDRLVANAVQLVLPEIAAAIDAIAGRMSRGGRLVYVGAGTSGRLGVLDASECPPTFNTPPRLVIGLIAGGDQALRHPIEAVEDDPSAGADALAGIGLAEKDSVVGIAASGRTPYTLGALAYAREQQALTIALCNTEGSALSCLAKFTIAPVVGAEVITGSTRLKSGTAQKLVLNMLSTGVMIRLGKTYGNLMVDMQTSNAKLHQRAVNMVSEVTGVEEEIATDALGRAGGSVKTAIVAVLLGITSDDAKLRLEAAGGRVRIALGDAGV